MRVKETTDMSEAVGPLATATGSARRSIGDYEHFSKLVNTQCTRRRRLKLVVFIIVFGLIVYTVLYIPWPVDGTLQM